MNKIESSKIIADTRYFIKKMCFKECGNCARIVIVLYFFSLMIGCTNKNGAMSDKMIKKPPRVGTKTPGTGSNPVAYRRFPIAETLALEYRSTLE
jgi:hypothetical protein